MGKLTDACCKAQKQTRLRIYNTLAIPILRHINGTCTLNEEDKARITAADMAFLRQPAKYTLHDHKMNQDIIKEFKT
jgi:hypothetical protein